MISSSQNLVAYEGRVATLWGTGFTANCTIKLSDGLNTYTPNVIDVDETKIVFMPPAVGSYTLSVYRGSTLEISGIKVAVLELQYLPVQKLPKRTLRDFALMLKGLLPRGFLWNIKWVESTSEKSNWQKLLESIAAGLKYVWDILSLYLAEASPVTTTSFDAFENELALPQKGLSQSTDDGRRNEILRICRNETGVSVPYLKRLLDLYGADYVLYEYWKNPSVFPSWVAQQYGTDAVFCVLVKVYKEQFAHAFKCTSKCNDTLGDERDLALESIMNHEKPAHVKFIFEYAIRILTNDDENPLLDDQNRILIV